MDPFTTFDLPPTLALDAEELETAYLRLSRECHPDHHAADDDAARVRILARAAEVNAAYRALRDPWRRAELVVERVSPGALERTKQLSPVFLMQAMELAEEVHASRGDDSALEQRIRRRLADYLARIARAVDAGDGTAAAIWLHESRYYRKALADLLEARDTRRDTR